MSLVYETLKINVLSARVADEAPLLERRMVALGLADVFYAYLVRQDPGLARQFPMPKGRRMVILGAIVSPCEKFAVAHEYGHAIAGHLVKDKQVARETPAGNLELIQKSSDQEYEADAIGAKIMVADYDPARERAPYYFDLAARIGGALYLFALDDLLTATGGALTGPRPTIVSDHPPARERAERLRESFLGMGFARSAFDLADAYRLWLTSLGAEVVELVSQRFRAEGPQSQA
jgi:hypothetical protein